MTRYARAGKGGTHQRIAKDSTAWNELKPPPPERLRGSKNNDKPRPGRKFKKERFSKQKFQDANAPALSPPSSAMEQDSGKTFQKKKFNSNSKIRGFGQSKSVQIFGQFWVPLEDAKRLKNLLKKLREQGLPRKEILEVLKNDRRKAEKATKRQRDKTCFQCRQFGHVLSDCPNLRKAIAMPGSGGSEEDATGSSEMASEICFKCGSTEHTSRKCRRKGEKFSFAKCFICSGSGHIARQCPQNTNGIYPSGGCCGECGFTTHLKKDCPNLVGVEHNPSLVDNDPDAVTLRMADPFSSTEYEPVFDVNADGKEGECDKDKDKFDELEKKNPTNISIEERKFHKKVKTNNKKGNKRKMNEEMDSSTFEFGLSSAPTKPMLPVKRKIVKF